MQKAVKRAMDAYALMVNLSPEHERLARERLEKHLSELDGDDNTLAVEGLKFLRDPRPVRQRRAHTPSRD